MLDQSFAEQFSAVVRRRIPTRDVKAEYFGDFSRTKLFDLSLIVFRDTMEASARSCELWMCVILENRVKSAVLVAEKSRLNQDRFTQFSMIQSSELASKTVTLMTLFPFSRSFSTDLILGYENKLSTNYPIVIGENGVILSEAT